MKEREDFFYVVIDGINSVVYYYREVFGGECGENVVGKGVIGESGREKGGCFI